jgi:outer membrane lipoprotein-sorting protein
VNCEQTQLVFSTRMDGERVGAREAEAAAAHAEGCVRCQLFAQRTTRIRSSVRIRVAEQVPDLVEPIMAAVARERIRPSSMAPVIDGWIGSRRVSRRPRHRRPKTLAPAVAAAIAGLIVGSLVVGGPWQLGATRPIAAATVVRDVRNAAPALQAFQGSYTIHEFGLSPEVPERLLEMDVAFRSPQRFRLEVDDRTDYPSSSWTPTDLLFIGDVTTTFTSGPSGCPGDLPEDVCPRTRATTARLSEYSAAAPLPADLVLPVATFGSTRGLQVLDRERFDGRDAVLLRLSFERAAPMFPFLRIGGTWRPFFDRDKVLLWLDAGSWLPLRMAVYPSRSGERRGWELRYGRRVESPDAPILDVRMDAASETPPDVSLFRIPGAPTSLPPRLDELPASIGYAPATPGDAGDLELVSIVLPTASAPVTPSSLLVYAKGLDYLKVAERRDWNGPGPFGPVDGVAQQVPLGGDGVAYYEPAGEGYGRRLAIHTPRADLFLETNLPRERLLEIAASLPVRGEALPSSWSRLGSPGVKVERVGVVEALATAGLPASLPERLPEGYVVASAELSKVGTAVEGATLYLRQPDMDAAGEPLTLHIERETGLPSPSSSTQSRIRFAGVEGRWTPTRSQLEWVDGGVYHSLQGELGLRALLEIASAIAGVRS